MQEQVDQILNSLDKASVQIATHLSVVKSVEIGPSVQNLNETMDMINALQIQRSLSDFHYDASLLFSHYDKVYSTRYGFIDVAEFPYKDVIKLIQIRYNSTVFIPPDTFPNQHEFLLLRPVPILFDDVVNGIIVLHLDSSRFTSLLNQVQLGNDRKLFILNEQGVIIAGQESAEIGEKLATTSELYQIWNESDNRLKSLQMDKVNYSLSVQKSDYNDWTYIALVPIAQLEQQAYFIRNVTWAIVGIIILLWLFVAMIGSNQLYNPVRRLLGKISDGKEVDGLEAIDSFIQKIVVTNEQLRSKLGEQLPYIKDSFSLQLMRGELSNSEIMQKSAAHHITLQNPYVCVLLVDMDGFYVFQKQYDEKDRSLLMYALRKMVEEIVEERLSIVTVTSTLGQIAIVTESGNSALEPELHGAAVEILERVRQYFTFTVTVSLSLKRQGLTGIPIAFRESSELLGYRLLLGDDRLITQDDIKPSVQQSRMTLVRWQKQIVSSLVNGQQEEAEAVLKELVKLLPQYIHSSETVLGLFAYLIGELEFLIVDSGGETNHLLDDDPYKQLYGKDTLGQITEWLTESVFPSIIGYMQGMDKQKRMVQQALLYTKEHYQTDLSLQQTADHLNVPHYQLSKAFKEVTGINFSDYVIRLRIEKAKEWLVHTDMELKEISEKLSYATVQNLSRIFKQMVGVPPGQYRKQNRM